MAEMASKRWHDLQEHLPMDRLIKYLEHFVSLELSSKEENFTKYCLISNVDIIETNQLIVALLSINFTPINFKWERDIKLKRINNYFNEHMRKMEVKE